MGRGQWGEGGRACRRVDLVTFAQSDRKGRPAPASGTDTVDLLVGRRLRLLSLDWSCLFVGFFAFDFHLRGYAAILDRHLGADLDITGHFRPGISGDLPFLIALLYNDGGVGKFEHGSGDLIRFGLGPAQGWEREE